MGHIYYWDKHMQNYRSRTFVLVLFFTTLILITTSYSQITAREAEKLMQRGINIGNTFDAPGGETSWGQPAIKEHYFDDYVDAGFTAIRIPVTWGESHQDTKAPYGIHQEFIDRVEQVVDWGLERDLFILLNVHHDGWVKHEYANETKDRFLALWTQIAERFKDKSHKLLFEILNEPEELPQGDLDNLHADTYSLLRSSGGKNAERIIVFSGTKWSSANEIVLTQIPDNDHTYLMANFHSYHPWNWISNDEGAPWNEDWSGPQGEFDKVKSWSDQNDIAVMVNEWGAPERHDYHSRMEWYRCYMHQIYKHGFAAFHWDDGGMFKLYNRNERTWHKEVKDIITSPAFSKDGLKAVGYYKSSETISRIESTSDGAGVDHYIGDISDGSWVSYMIEVPTTGTYTALLNIASQNGGRFTITDESDVTVFGSLDVPETGGYDAWELVMTEVSLQKGFQEIVFNFETGGFNVSSVQFLEGAFESVESIAVSPQTEEVLLDAGIQLEATLAPSTASIKKVTWGSTNEEIATINAEGMVRVIKSGTVTFTATATDGSEMQGATTLTFEQPHCGVTSSGNDGNVPESALDGNLTTRWSSDGIGEYITINFCGEVTLDSLMIAWFKGDFRKSYFSVEISTDGEVFTEIAVDTSSGMNEGFEKVVVPQITASSIRIVNKGNSENSWISIYEIGFGWPAPPKESSAMNSVMSSQENTSSQLLSSGADALSSSSTEGEISPVLISTTLPTQNYLIFNSWNPKSLSGVQSESLVVVYDHMGAQYGAVSGADLEQYMTTLPKGVYVVTNRN